MAGVYAEAFLLSGGITLLRHGHAAQTVPDWARSLDDVGYEQVRSMKKVLSAYCGGGRYDLVVVSHLCRAQETLITLLEDENATNVLDHALVVPELIEHPDPKCNERCDALFQRLKYSPLAQYLAEPDGRLVMELARFAAASITDRMEEQKLQLARGSRVLVVGHAVILNALVLALFESVRRIPRIPGMSEIQRMAETLVLGEAEAIHISPGPAGLSFNATHIRRP